METPWQQWKRTNAEKQQSGKVSPLDFINPDTEYVSEEKAEERYEICKECPHFLVTKQCSKCGCFMPAKTTMKYATCPINKW
jgi:hypothetical protein